MAGVLTAALQVNPAAICLVEAVASGISEPAILEIGMTLQGTIAGAIGLGRASEHTSEYSVLWHCSIQSA